MSPTSGSVCHRQPAPMATLPVSAKTTDWRRVGHPCSHSTAMPSPTMPASTETVSVSPGKNGVAPHSTLAGTSTSEAPTTAIARRVAVPNP